MLRSSSKRRGLSLLFAALLLFVVGFVPTATARAATPTATTTYTNPLRPVIPAGGVVESCADPSIIKGQKAGDNNWYMYCTSDPLNNADVNQAETDFNFHKITMHSSPDLINWTYVGDAFSSTNAPTYAMSNSGFWAPDIRFLNGTYYLYFTVTDTVDATCNAQNKSGGSSIGLATSTSPYRALDGQWCARRRATRRTVSATDCNFFWTFDPDVLQTRKRTLYIYYGSYYGGIQVRPLSADGLTTDPTKAVQVTIANRYEGAYVVQHNWLLLPLFASAANCCAGPVTGYSVFAGRSKSPTGPFRDREGVSLLAGRVGGTPVISMNGNQMDRHRPQRHLYRRSRTRLVAVPRG